MFLHFSNIRVVLVHAVATCILVVLSSATPPCFVEPVWAPTNVLLHRDIVYGSAYNAFTHADEELKLDLYTPPATDLRVERPFVVLVHGGAFISGDKTEFEPLATSLATRGFVVASINYRLTGRYWGTEEHFPGTGGVCCPGNASDRYAFDAAEDGFTAISFLQRYALQFHLDTSRFGVAGGSAGAVAALFMGYAMEGWPHVFAVFRPRVIVSISGELQYDAFCEGFDPSGDPYGCRYGSWNRTNEINGRSHMQPALGLVHGTCDQIVPYREAVAMQRRANETGLVNRLVTITGAGHVPQRELLEVHMPELMEFLYDTMALAGAECPKHNLIEMMV